MVRRVQGVGASYIAAADDGDNNKTNKTNGNGTITVPVGQTQTKPQAPIKGAELEHQPSAQATTKTDDTEPSDDTEGSSDDTTQSTTTEDGGGYADVTSTLNDTYNDLKAKEAELMGKSSEGLSKLPDLSEALDAIENIDDQSEANFSFLRQRFPKSGNISGGSYFSTTSDRGGITNTFQTYLKNDWQNKGKNFALSFTGAIGIDWTKSNNFDITDALDDSDDDTEETTTPTDDQTTQTPNSFDRDYTGSVTLRARFDREKWTYGAGLSSHFYGADGRQAHYANVTALYKPLGMGLDFRRDTFVTRDEDGNRIVRGETKAKFSILDNDPEGDDEFFVNNQSTTDITSSDDTQDETTTYSTAPFSSRKKDGSGWDFDIKYDDSQFGATAGYGYNFIYNPEKKVRLTMTAIGGLYDEKEQDGENEAFSFLAGTQVEFKKRWQNGQNLDATLDASFNRIIQKGSKPQDTSCISFKGRYSYPKKNLSATLDAGYIHTAAIRMGYVEGNESNCLSKTLNSLTNLVYLDLSDNLLEGQLSNLHMVI